MGKEIAKRNQSDDPAQQQGIARLSEIDFQELFHFKPKHIALGPTEAWCIDLKDGQLGKNNIMAFGPGARRLAVAVGLEYLMPERIFVEGAWHSNPYVVFKSGKAIGVWMMKHGIAIAREGIRYLQPVLDYIDLNAIVAKLAMKCQERLLKESPNSVRECTRQISEKMNAEYQNPGDPIWWFCPTMDDDTGLAFNQAEPSGSKAAWQIRKLKEDVTSFRQYPLRKIQSSTDRRVFEMLFPEARTAYNEATAKTHAGDYGVIKVLNAEYTLEVPTTSPIARQMLMEFGIALRDSDSESRQAKLADIMNVLGGSPTIKSIAAGVLIPDEVIEETVATAPPGEIVKLKPCPTGMTNKEFIEYYNSEFRKLTPAQKEEVRVKIGLDTWEGFKLKTKYIPIITEFFMAVAGIAPQPDPTGEIKPDDMRKHMLSHIEQNDGDGGFLDTIMVEHGFPTDMDMGLIPDEAIVKIYSEFTRQLANQGETIKNPE